MVTRKRETKTEAGDRVILVKDASDKEFKVTIPADAKVTFGPSFPSARKGGEWNPASRMEYALRIYKGTKDNCIAVFTGVREFRELDMQVDRLVVSEAGKTLWRSDEGGYTVSTAVKKKSKFVDAKLLNTGSTDRDVEDGPF